MLSTVHHLEPENNNINVSSVNMPRLHQLLCILSKNNKTRFIPQLQRSDDTVAAFDPEKAEVLNAYFVGQSEQSGPIPRISGTPHKNKLDSIEFSVREVQNLLNRLDIKNSAGDDGVPTVLLRLASNYIVPHVHHLFSLSLKTGCLSEAWKQATVIPIHNKRKSFSAF